MKHGEHRGHGEARGNASLCFMVPRLFSVASVVSVLTLFPGCIRDFGKGGTGELVVRPRVLREIDAIDVADYAVPAPPLATQPTTQALTQPSTKPTPPEEYRLRIEDVRRLALRNNLDLRVELINPA